MFGTPQRVSRALQQVGAMANGVLPVGGINARDSFAQMPPSDAIELINLIPDHYGLTVRSGYQEFATDLPSTLPVRTIMSYYPPTVGVSAPTGTRADNGRANITLAGQLFACTNLGIYDITAGGSGPWTTQPGVGAVTSDYWTWLNFQNAGGNFLLATNDEGGYVAYGSAGFSNGFSSGFRTQASGFFRVQQGTSGGDIQNIDPDLFCFIAVWKRRLWFVEINSSKAWYLPVEQITGEATMWDFGPFFRHGGHLVSIVNWTIDGGEGIDDYLVAFGSEGDVVIFKGYDPDSAGTDPSAFQLHGIWYIGPLPSGRRQADPYGGDIFVTSMFGITEISKLVQKTSAPIAAIRDITYKIDPLIQRQMRTTLNLSGWYIKALPREEILVVGAPELITGQGPTQFGTVIPEEAWFRFSHLPFGTYTNHGGLIFAGGQQGANVNGNGIVYLAFDVALDNVPLDSVDGVGVPIRVRAIPAYQSLGPPGMNKQFTAIRPSFLVAQDPALTIRVLTDYALPSFANVPTLPQVDAALWNVGVWNVAKWGGLRFPIRKWLGVVGSGFAATAQIDLTAAGDTRLMSLDWWVIPGGPL